MVHMLYWLHCCFSLCVSHSSKEKVIATNLKNIHVVGFSWLLQESFTAKILLKVLYFPAFTKSVSTYEIKGPSSILKEICVFSWGMWLCILPHKFFATRNFGMLTACRKWHTGYVAPIMKRVSNAFSDAKCKEEKDNSGFFLSPLWYCSQF